MCVRAGGLPIRCESPAALGDATYYIGSWLGHDSLFASSQNVWSAAGLQEVEVGGTGQSASSSLMTVLGRRRFRRLMPQCE